jgi:hypothetical protein
MVITNQPEGGWPQFYAKIEPYIKGVVPDAPHIVAAYFRGFLYMKGTASTPVQTYLYNGVTGVSMGCLRIYEGYWLFETFGTGQSSLTLNDGGLDPDGVDRIVGNYTLDPSIPTASCPTSSILY